MPGQSHRGGCGDAAPSELVFELLLRHSDSVFMVLSATDDTVLYASPNAERELDGTPATRIGRALLTALHPDDEGHAAAMLRAVQAAPPGTAPAFAHVRLRMADAGCLWSELKLSSDGEHTYCVLRNVTAEKRVEQTLNHFLATTSHDVRSPCHGMQVASALLADCAAARADAAAAELLAVIRDACRINVACIENVLELQGCLDSAACAALRERARARKPLDLAATLADVVKSCRRAGAAAAAWPGEAAEREALPALEGPPDMVRRVLKNLLLAVAQLAGGAHLIIAELAPLRPAPGAPPGSLDIAVAVTAPGRALSPADVGAAFEACSGAGGAGLALCVARAFARAMDGNVRIAATPAGARVEATMRLFRPQAPESPRDVPSPRKALPARKPSFAGAPPPAVELTARMFRHMIRDSDDFFSSGIVGDAGVAFEFGSAATESFFGCLPRNISRLNIGQFLHPDDARIALHAFQAAVASSLAAGGAPVALAYTHRLRIHCGDYCPVHTSGCVVGARWHTVCRKLSAQQAREAAARNLLVAVGAALHAPARAACDAARALARLPCVAADAEAAFAAQAVAASATLLLCTLQNVAALPAVEAGALPRRPPTRFAPVAAAAELMAVCRVACCARAPRVDWAGGAPPQLPSAVLGDAALFDRVLLNLITNAIRFDDGKGVTVTAECSPILIECQASTSTEDGAAATHMLAVTVADRGPGLAPAEAALVFEPFHAAPTAAGGGVGLGLCISRASARAAGGDVTLATAPGQGAAFTLRMPVTLLADDDAEPRAADSISFALTTALGQLTLDAGGCAAAPRADAPPLAEAPAPAPCSGDDASLPQLRCHLADDHALNLTLVRRLLERSAGFAVETSADGREAYDKITAACARGEPPHLILLDMQMPIWGGPKAARALRAWEAAAADDAAAPRLPIFALTANCLEAHRLECVAAGMDGFLTKPLGRAALPQLQQRAREYERKAAQLAAASEA